MFYSQRNRTLKIDTPLGEDVLLLTGFSGGETISRLFMYNLSLVSPKKDIDFKAIIGKPATVSYTLSNGDTRNFNGVITSFSQGESGTNEETGESYALYSATLSPALWLLDKTSDCEIFQNLSVPEIVEKVLKDNKLNDYRFDIKESYPKWEYCVQYNETDLHFISRLLEEEGIYFFFEHEKSKHTLVLTDRKDCHKKCPNRETARFKANDGHVREDEVISLLSWGQNIRFGKHTIKDFNFETPHTKLMATTPSNHDIGPGEREAYYYSSGHDSISEGKRLAKIRMQEEAAQGTAISGSSDCRAFASGFRFMLQDYYRTDMNNKEYLLTSVSHVASQTVGDGSNFSYSNSFNCIPYEVQYRPPCITIKPTMPGSQTATVTGPKGEEIYIDNHGRVKVQFHWDRYGKKNEKSSCWIRVSYPGSSKGFGFQSHPRIGDEVIVDFLEGDPDRPIITGAVYNASNIGTFKLPDHKTRSVFRQDSTPGGGGYNEIHFENKKGSEDISIHAQKDMNTTVQNNRTTTVKNNRTTSVIVNDTLNVDANRTVLVKGKMTETVVTGQEVTISSGYKETISGGVNSSITDGLERKVGGAINYTSDTSIKLTVGGSVVLLTPNDITISSGGSTIKIDAAGISLDGKKISLNG